MLFLSGAEQITRYIGENHTGLSPRLWADLIGSSMRPDGSDRLTVFFDDFMNAGGAVASNVGGWSGYKTYEDTGSSIKTLATAVGGVLRFATGTTDNNECWLQAQYDDGVQAVISDTAANAKKLWFECRVRFTQITDTYNVFVGLMEEARAAADTITDAGAMGDFDMIGFRVLEADGDEVNFVYKKAGQTINQKIDALKAIAADTWYKFGFKYDPAADTTQRIKIYVDNVEQSTYVTGANIDTADFPDGEEMAVIAGCKTGAAADKSFDLDWIALAQYVA